MSEASFVFGVFDENSRTIEGVVEGPAHRGGCGDTALGFVHCGLPLVSQRREHIVIDTFDPLMSARVKRALDVVAEIVCSLTLGGIGYLIFRRAARVAEYGDTTSVLKWPLAPVAYLMGTMILIACLIHLSLIFVPHGEDDGKSIV